MLGWLGLGAAALSLGSGLFRRSQSKKAGKQARLGFDFLRESAIGKDYLPAGGRAVQHTNALLGLGGDTEAARAAFNNYLDSTGYKFELGEGQNAIASSAAARGLLNSGATAKALTRFGQNLASQRFNSYLDQVGRVADRGMAAGSAIGAAGTPGGQAQAGYTMAGGNALLSGIGSVFGSIFGGAR